MSTKTSKKAILKKAMGKCPDCGKSMKDCSCKMDGMGGPGFAKVKKAVKGY